MAATQETYTLSDKIMDRIERPYRLVLWLVLFGLAFLSGRLFFFLAVTVIAFVGGLKTRRFGGGRLAAITGVVALLFFTAHVYSYTQSQNIEQFVNAHSPVTLALLPDGDYVGTGKGINGDITAIVTVEKGVLKNMRLLDYREPVYAFDEAIAAIIGAHTTDFSNLETFVFRNRQSLAGLEAAATSALVPHLPGYPAPGMIEKVTFFFTENRFGRITINALAIIFIAILTFDFFLQPALVPGTGQSLNCYNCQACVGVCPVKMIAGDPFPMIMVIEARAGNYEKVAQLAKYCVGCGKCAAKCPVGNSGPSVASSSLMYHREQKRRENRREKAAARQVFTVEKLSEIQENELAIRPMDQGGHHES